MIDVVKVKKRLSDLGLNQSHVAAAWNVAQPTANQKLNRVRPISLDEAEILSELLKLSPTEFGEYFFAS